MARRIAAIIAILWGGALLVSYLLGYNRPEGSGAYAAGQWSALVFALILLAAGLIALWRGRRT